MKEPPNFQSRIQFITEVSVIANVKVLGNIRFSAHLRFQEILQTHAKSSCWAFGAIIVISNQELFKQRKHKQQIYILEKVWTCSLLFSSSLLFRLFVSVVASWIGLVLDVIGSVDISLKPVREQWHWNCNWATGANGGRTITRRVSIHLIYHLPNIYKNIRFFFG